MNNLIFEIVFNLILNVVSNCLYDIFISTTKDKDYVRQAALFIIQEQLVIYNSLFSVYNTIMISSYAFLVLYTFPFYRAPHPHVPIAHT